MLRLNGSWSWVLALTCTMVLPGGAFAFRSGPPPGRNGSTASLGASCIGCHSAGVGGSVEILGVPTNYEASTTYHLTVHIADAAQAGAGFQLSVEDNAGTHVGTLVITDATNTQPNGGWVNHTFTGVDNSVTNWSGLGNAAEYNVDWVSPASDVGTVTFWAAGNAINNDSSLNGDQVYLTNVSAAFSLPVPAASTWGLVTLTLLMIVTASVLLVRRPKPIRIGA